MQFSTTVRNARLDASRLKPIAVVLLMVWMCRATPEASAQGVPPIVSAVNTAGLEGAQSATLTTNTATMPSVVVNLRLEVTIQ